MSQTATRSVILSLTLLLVFSAGALSAAAADPEGFPITIDVAPNIINLSSQGTVVTVHTDIGYYAVAGSTVYLNGVPIYFWKSDARGYFVAKFRSQDVKNLPLVIDGYNTLTMVGTTKAGDAFWGTQDILVIDRGPGR
jgi:hypothetical protein